MHRVSNKQYRSLLQMNQQNLVPLVSLRTVHWAGILSLHEDKAVNPWKAG